MKSKNKIELKWKNLFLKSALVRNGKLDLSLAKAVFRGAGDFPAHLDDLSGGFRNFSVNSTDSPNDIDRLNKFLLLIGIELSDEKLINSLNNKTVILDDVLRHTALIYKTLFYSNASFNVNDPYSNNYGDLNFFLRLELGEKSGVGLSLLDNPAEIYNKYIKLPQNYESDPDVKSVFNEIENTNRSFYLTGKAGTGKSTFIHYLTQKTKKKSLLLSFTGIAAVNIGGQTIHSFFAFPFKPLLPKDVEIKTFLQHWTTYDVIRNVDMIIIDEVSMLRSDIMEAIDHSLKINGGDNERPFGGKQMIFVGDPYQLPPVVESTNINKELFSTIYASEYFFDSPAFQMLQPESIEFSKIHRQKDNEFINILNKIRDYSITEDEIDYINSICVKDDLINDNDKKLEIRLSTNKYISKQENFKRLEELQNKEFVFEAEISGDYSADKYPAPQHLRLKRDAQVMFVKNDPHTKNRRWMNGTISKIHFVTDEIIEVEMDDAQIHQVEKVEWESRKYKWDKKENRIVSEVVGTYRQFPLRLAWSITIHKSQGLTFNNVRVDLGRRTFAPGQLYTALSRCRSFKGLSLVRPIILADIIVDKRISDFDNNQENQILINGDKCL